MNISITFRHMDASEAIKAYAREKVAKLQKFLRQPMTAKVTLSLDKLRHVAETRVSSGGAHLEAKESTEDMYVSIDRVIGKLERQIRATKGTAQAKKRRGATVRTAEVEAAAPVKKLAKTPAKKKASVKKAPARTARAR